LYKEKSEASRRQPINSHLTKIDENSRSRRNKPTSAKPPNHYAPTGTNYTYNRGGVEG